MAGCGSGALKTICMLLTPCPCRSVCNQALRLGWAGTRVLPSLQLLSSNEMPSCPAKGLLSAAAGWPVLLVAVLLSVQTHMCCCLCCCAMPTLLCEWLPPLLHVQQGIHRLLDKGGGAPQRDVAHTQQEERKADVHRRCGRPTCFGKTCRQCNGHTEVCVQACFNTST